METSLQQELLSLVQDEIGAQIKLSDYLSDALGLSKTSAYRVTVDQRSLQLEECFQLLHEHPAVYLKLSESFSFRNRILIRLSNFQCEDSFQNYLRSIQKIFSKAIDEEAVKLYYTARDLPIFYFLARPRLLEYKYAYWQGTLRDQGPQPLSAATHKLAEAVYKLYLEVSSQEVWHPYAYRQQKKLLASAFREGSIDEKQRDQIQADLNWLSLQLHQALMSGQKSPRAKLEIFDLAEHSMDNCGILHLGEQKLVMSALPVARFFSSQHPDLVATYLAAFKDHRRRARGISAEGKQVREEWFEEIGG